MAQGGGPLIVAGREHAAYCFEVLTCYFSGESPASPRFVDHHWCVPPPFPFPFPSTAPPTSRPRLLDTGCPALYNTV